LVFLFRFTKEVPSLQVVQVRASFGTAWAYRKELTGNNIVLGDDILGLESLLIFIAAANTDSICTRDFSDVELEKYLVTCSIYGIPECGISDFDYADDIESKGWSCISSREQEVGPQEFEHGSEEWGKRMFLESPFEIEDRLVMYKSLMYDIKKLVTESFYRCNGLLCDKEGLVYHEYVLVKLTKVS
jgi:hypothetical protein